MGMYGNGAAISMKTSAVVIAAAAGTQARQTAPSPTGIPAPRICEATIRDCVLCTHKKQKYIELVPKSCALERSQLVLEQAPLAKKMAEEVWFPCIPG
jgi:hypothetical protein